MEGSAQPSLATTSSGLSGSIEIHNIDSQKDGESDKTISTARSNKSSSEISNTANQLQARVIDYFLVFGIDTSDREERALETNGNTSGPLEKKGTTSAESGDTHEEFDVAAAKNVGEIVGSMAENSMAASRSNHDDHDVPTEAILSDRSAPELLFRYPDSDSPDAPFPSGIAPFCFPTGACLNQEKQTAPECFGFVLTEQDGCRLFCSAIRIWLLKTNSMEESHHVAMDRSRISKQNLASGKQNERAEQRIWVPRCLVLVSHWPFWTQMENALIQLYNATLASAKPLKFPIERAIVNIVGEVPLPPAGLLDVEAPFLSSYVHSSQPLLFCRPSPNKLPLRDFSLTLPFRLLSVENVMIVFSAILTERKVMFVSNELRHLTMVAECFNAFIHPFSYPHVFIPLLPAMMADFVAAPMPFVVGVHASCIPNGLMDVLLVNLDNNEICMYGIDGKINTNDLNTAPPPLPEKRGAALIKRIRRCMGENFQRTKVTNVDQVEIENALLEFFGTLLKNYREYLEPSNDVGATHFDKTRFVGDHADKGPFLEQLVESQAFQAFIDRRHAHASVDNYDVLFFDEIIDQLQGKPAPFLTDTTYQHKLDKRYHVPLPNTSDLPVNKVYRYTKWPDLDGLLLSIPRAIPLLAKETGKQQRVELSKLAIAFFHEKRLLAQQFSTLRFRSKKQDRVFADITQWFKSAQALDETSVTNNEAMCSMLFSKPPALTGTSIDAAWQQVRQSCILSAEAQSKAISIMRKDAFLPLWSSCAASEHQLQLLFKEASILEYRVANGKSAVDRAKAREATLGKHYRRLKDTHRHQVLAVADRLKLIEAASAYEDAVLCMEEAEAAFGTLFSEFETRTPEIVESIRLLNKERIAQLKSSMQIFIDVKRNLYEAQLSSLAAMQKRVEQINPTNDLDCFTNGTVDFWISTNPDQGNLKSLSSPYMVLPECLADEPLPGSIPSKSADVVNASQKIDSTSNTNNECLSKSSTLEIPGDFPAEPPTVQSVSVTPSLEHSSTHSSPSRNENLMTDDFVSTPNATSSAQQSLDAATSISPQNDSSAKASISSLLPQNAHKTDSTAVDGLPNGNLLNADLSGSQARNFGVPSSVALSLQLRYLDNSKTNSFKANTRSIAPASNFLQMPICYALFMWGSEGFRKSLAQLLATKNVIKGLIELLTNFSDVHESHSRKLGTIFKNHPYTSQLDLAPAQRRLWESLRATLVSRLEASNELRNTLLKLVSDLRVTKGELKATMRRLSEHRGILERDVQQAAVNLSRAVDRRNRAARALATVEGSQRQISVEYITQRELDTQSTTIQRAMRELKETDHLQSQAQREQAQCQRKFDLCNLRLLALCERREKKCAQDIADVLLILNKCLLDKVIFPVAAVFNSGILAARFDVETEMRNAVLSQHAQQKDFGEQLEWSRFYDYHQAMSQLERGVEFVITVKTVQQDIVAVDEAYTRSLRRLTLVTKSNMPSMNAALEALINAVLVMTSNIEERTETIRMLEKPLAKLRNDLKKAIKERASDQTEIERCFQRLLDERTKIVEEEEKVKSQLMQVRAKIEKYSVTQSEKTMMGTLVNALDYVQSLKQKEASIVKELDRIHELVLSNSTLVEQGAIRRNNSTRGNINAMASLEKQRLFIVSAVCCKLFEECMRLQDMSITALNSCMDAVISINPAQDCIAWLKSNASAIHSPALVAETILKQTERNTVLLPLDGTEPSVVVPGLNGSTYPPSSTSSLANCASISSTCEQAAKKDSKEKLSSNLTTENTSNSNDILSNKAMEIPDHCQVSTDLSETLSLALVPVSIADASASRPPSQSFNTVSDLERVFMHRSTSSMSDHELEGLKNIE